MRVLDRRRLAAGLLAPLVVLSACSSGGSAGDAAPATAEPGAPDLAAGSVDSSPTPAAESDSSPASDAETHHSGPSPDEPAEMLTASTMAAAMQEATDEHRTSRYSMTVVGAGSTTADMVVDGVVDYRGRSPLMSLTMSGPALGGATGEVRVLRDTMYVSMPPMTPDGTFIEVDLRDQGDPMAAMPAPGDPMNAFGSFATDLQAVEYVGEESVSGEDLHHYVVTMDGESVAEAMKLATGRLPRTIDYDLWLDDDALMRRMTIDFQSEGTLEIEMWDWGEPVTVEAPPREDIAQP